MADDLAISLLNRQRKRLVANLLNAAEGAPWWAKLSPAEQRQYRDRVMVAAGTYHDFCVDMVKVAGESSGVRNDAVLELVQQVHDSQTRLERQFGAKDLALNGR